MLMMYHSDHNHLTVVPNLHPHVWELQVEIPVRVDPTTMNSNLHKHPGEFMPCKSTSILDLEYWKMKFVLITINDFELLMDSKNLSTG